MLIDSYKHLCKGVLPGCLLNFMKVYKQNQKFSSNTKYKLVKLLKSRVNKNKHLDFIECSYYTIIIYGGNNTFLKTDCYISIKQSYHEEKLESHVKFFIRMYVCMCLCAFINFVTW